jgi:nucleoside-triphosphatase
MKKRLFLSGPIGCGKSTLIKDALGGAAKGAGGFITARAFDNTGAHIGFDLLPSCSLACPDRQCPSFRFLTFSDTGARRSSSVFRTEAVRLLEKALEKPFAVLDELGGFELLTPEFNKALAAFFESGVPCVGVVKTPAAAAALRERTDLPPNYLDRIAELLAALGADPETENHPTAGRYDKNTKAALGAWVEEYARGG